MIHKIDNKTRIKLKFLFNALDTVICLQRKKWYGWKTVSFTYPSIIIKYNSNYEEVKLYLEHKEKRNRFKSKRKTETEFGAEIMSSWENNF